VALAEELYETILADGVDVLHVHYLVGLLEVALLARQRLARASKKIRIVATLHGSEVSNFAKNPTYCKKMAGMLDECDAVSAVSHWLARESARVFGMRHTPEVIWNSVDIGRYNPAQWDGRRQNLTPFGRPLLCHVSNFRPVKRTVDTVEIQASLAAMGISARLLLIGQGPDFERAMDRARQLGTHDLVIPVGPLAPEALARYMAASDVVLVTSESESFSLAALEAMSCGIPVVGTRCGGLEEVVNGINWKQGANSRLLADVGDVQAMAEICATLLSDRFRYWSTQFQGIFAPLTRFHLDRQTEGYLRLIDGLT
jgi:N-acetyl-alpha-D-glucosaminyl L-malate synthase BshA